MATCFVGALIVLPDGPRAVPLRVNRGRVVGFDGPRRGDIVVELRDCTLFPGLINAHDHLELNHYPRSKFRAVYPNAHAWGEDFLPRLDEAPYAELRRLPLDEQCRIGMLKNVRAGVTTVAHHNPLHRPLRAPDLPIRVLGVQQYGWAHSLHFTPEPEIRASFRRTSRRAPWMIHLAEGTDAIAAGEFARLDALGCLRANTVLIHGVGLSGADQDRALAVGAGLVWCPSTNLFLLGATGQVARFAQAGRLALGTDSRLTADGDLFDELRAARATGQLADAALFRAVTTDAARLLRLPDVGALGIGYRADLFAVHGTEEPLARLFTLRPADVIAVYRDGRRVL